MAPVRSYTNWNSRTTDEEEQIEPYRKYFFICEGANTETWYSKKVKVNLHSQMVPTQGITWLFSCPDIIPNNINPRQERR